MQGDEFMQALGLILVGVLVGIGASFSGLGGGFLIVPLLLFLGFSAQQAAGTAFMAILVISVSALAAHGRLDHIDYRVGILIGLGGLLGAQVGPRLLQQVSTEDFRRIFSVVLIGLAALLWVKK